MNYPAIRHIGLTYTKSSYLRIHGHIYLLQQALSAAVLQSRLPSERLVSHGAASVACP